MWWGKDSVDDGPDGPFVSPPVSIAGQWETLAKQLNAQLQISMEQTRVAQEGCREAQVACEEALKTLRDHLKICQSR